MPEPTLILVKPLFYKGQESMAICYPSNKSLDDVIRKLKGVRWYRSHGCWYLPWNAATMWLLKLP